MAFLDLMRFLTLPLKNKTHFLRAAVLFPLLCSAEFFSQTYTFNTAGSTGTAGPTQTQINTAYSSTSLNGSVTVNNGIQNFTVPVTGLYRIETRGAKGGNGAAPTGAAGAKMAGDFYLTSGQILKILVGQSGGNGTCGGGGGGSFVTDNNNSPICIAGGGGGGAYLNMYSFGASNATGSIGFSGGNGMNGNYSITASTGGMSGTGGASGVSFTYAAHVGAGGGGLTGDGIGGSPAGGGIAFINGGYGGPGATTTVGVGGTGGFGGGGGGDWSGATGAGGAGGYSGGGGGVHFGWGGGGGSYNFGSNPVNSAGSNPTVGLVIISRILSGVAISQTSFNSCNGYSTAALSATPVGGTSPYTYSWSPGGSTLTSISGLGAGTYTCSVTDASSITLTSSFVISQPGNLLASISSQSNVTCFGGANGKARVTIVGGTYPFTYSWSPAGGTSSLGVGFSASTYTCYINDANNCATTVTTTVTQATTLVNVSGYASNPVFCLGGGTHLIGTGASTYTWTGGALNGTYFYPTSSNSYTVTGFDAAGCTSSTGSAVVGVSVNPLPSVSISTLNALCTGNSATLVASGAPFYFWNTSSTSTSIVVSPTVTTTYSVTGTANTGCTNTAVRTVSVVSVSNVTANASSNSICQGATVTLSGSGASTYSWSNGVVNNVPFSPSSTAVYTVSGTNACGTSSSAITISVLIGPVITASATSSAICQGNTITLNGIGATSYTWSGGINNGISFTPSVTNTYSLLGTNGCGTSSTAITITVNPIPTITAIASSTSICLGNTVTLAGSGGTTYSWTGGVTNAVAFSPTLSTTYTVTGNDNNGCQNSAVKTISVGSPPSLTISVTNSVICFGNPVTLNGTGATTFTWSGGVVNNTPFVPTSSGNYTFTGSNSCGVSAAVAGITVNPLPIVGAIASNSTICLGGTTILQGTGAVNYFWTGGITNNIAFSPSVTTTYSVIGTDLNGCQNTSFKTITVNPTPTVTASASNTMVCTGNTVALNGSGALSYSWSNGVINNVAFSPTTTITYTLTGTDANGCQNTAIKTISVLSSPNATANSTSSAVCAGNSITLFGSGATSYSWTGGVTNNVPFIPSTTTTYSLTGSGFCGTSTAAITISVNALPGIFAITSSPSVCVGNTVSLIAGGASSYTWSGGILNNTPFTPTSSGNYTVTGTDLNGCQNTATIGVILIAPPIVSATSTNTFICIGNSIVLSGSGANIYIWSGGIANNVSFSPTVTSTYSLTGTNTLTGCSNQSTLLVVVNPLPVVFAVTSSSSICIGNSIVLTGFGANTYSWSNGVINGVAFSPTSTITYSLTGTNTLTGCTNTNLAHVGVTVNPLPVLTINASNTTVCIGNTITLNGGGASIYNWSHGVMNGIPFTPSTTTNYIVTGSNVSTGCTNTLSQNIIVNPLPTVSIVTNPPEICSGNTVILNATGADIYTWNNNVVNGIAFTPSVTSNYSVVGTYTLTGCSNNSSALVTVNQIPVITIISSDSILCAGATASLTASGANSYTWNGTNNGSQFVAQPLMTTSYSIFGVDLKGCSNSINYTQLVSECTGLHDIGLFSSGLKIYPNPSSGEFYLSSDASITLNILNEIGQVVKVVTFSETNRTMLVNDLANGIYIIVGNEFGHRFRQKVIVTK